MNRLGGRPCLRRRSLPVGSFESILDSTSRGLAYPALLSDATLRRSQSSFGLYGTNLDGSVTNLGLSYQAGVGRLVDIEDSPNFVSSPISEDMPTLPRPRVQIRHRPSLILGGEQYFASPSDTLPPTDNFTHPPSLPDYFPDTTTTTSSFPRTLGELSVPPYTCACGHPPSTWCCCHVQSEHKSFLQSVLQVGSLDIFLNLAAVVDYTASTLAKHLAASTSDAYVDSIISTLSCSYEKATWLPSSPVIDWAPAIGDVQEFCLRTAVGPRRRAVIIGINYTDQKWKSGPVPVGKDGRTRVPRLSGDPGDDDDMTLCTHKDANNIEQLIQSHGYKANEIRKLLDDGLDPALQPTKANIEEAMHWLVEDAYPGDNLFFYFAGHGEQVVDQDGDEDDGMDESILPVDHRGDVDQDIVDDDIFHVMVKPLPAGCKLTALVDCCHSGTILDLPFPHRLDSVQQLTDALVSGNVGTPISRKNTRKRSKPRRKGTGCTYTMDLESSQVTSQWDPRLFMRQTFGDAISISACMDEQLAYGGFNGGWMTNCFLKSLKTNSTPTYRELLKDTTKRINRIVHTANQRRGDGENPLPPQNVQLYSAHPLDLDAPFTF